LCESIAGDLRQLFYFIIYIHISIISEVFMNDIDQKSGNALQT